MIHFKRGDVGACDAHTPFFFDVDDLKNDLLGTNLGTRKTEKLTHFLVLGYRRIGSSLMGRAYRIVFFGGGIWWINGINVIPSEMDDASG